MATKEETKIKKYIEKRRKAYEVSFDHYTELRLKGGEHSALYKQRAKEADSAALALEHILYYIENGAEHPDLVQNPEQSDKKEEVTE